MQTLISLAKEFEELGDICLLVLHLGNSSLFMVKVLDPEPNIRISTYLAYDPDPDSLRKGKHTFKTFGKQLHINP